MDEKCYKCGCLVTDGEPTEIFLGRFQHHHTIDCVYALQRRVAELEARLAALQAQAVDWDWQPTEQEWRSVTDENPEPGELVEMLVVGYRDEWGHWCYPARNGSPIKAYRPID